MKLLSRLGVGKGAHKKRTLGCFLDIADALIPARRATRSLVCLGTMSPPLKVEHLSTNLRIKNRPAGHMSESHKSLQNLVATSPGVCLQAASFFSIPALSSASDSQCGRLQPHRPYVPSDLPAWACWELYTKGPRGRAPHPAWAAVYSVAPPLWACCRTKPPRRTTRGNPFVPPPQQKQMWPKLTQRGNFILVPSNDHQYAMVLVPLQARI